MPVPSIRDWATSLFVTATIMDDSVSVPIRFALNPPRALVRQGSSQTLTTAVWGSVTMDTEDFDGGSDGTLTGTTSGHSTVTNTSRYTAPLDGWYQVAGAVAFASNTAGRRGTRWAVNGTALNAGQIIIGLTWAATAQRLPAVTQQVFLNATDYVELQGFQDTGGNLATDVAAGGQSFMDVRYCGIP